MTKVWWKKEYRSGKIITIRITYFYKKDGEIYYGTLSYPKSNKRLAILSPDILFNRHYKYMVFYLEAYTIYYFSELLPYFKTNKI